MCKLLLPLSSLFFAETQRLQRKAYSAARSDQSGKCVEPGEVVYSRIGIEARCVGYWNHMST